LKKDDSFYIQSISDCINQIEVYTDNGEQEFLKSRLIQDAVIRNFEIIGEAVKRLSENFRSQNENVPWRQVAGFRDILIHEYFGVSLELVWQTVLTDLPKLKTAMVSFQKAKS
jgi:uncharacterized protein with HEPN domain